MKGLRKSGPYLLLVILLAINVVIWMQRDSIADWWRLRNYRPETDIVRLTTDTTMTDYATRLFYINHPSLENKDNFNRHCADKSEHTVVLGCYHGNRRGIYLFAVTDPRLQGVRQVTAAHEMLHQAYDRLAGNERQHVDKLLEAYYNSDDLSPELKAKLDSYKEQADSVLVNEMHSIFGTEVKNLPPALENYYKQYFTDRDKVVKDSEAYRGEFMRRQNLVKQYDTQLAELRRQIDENKSVLKQEMSFLNNKEQEIDGDVTSRDQAAYETDVAQYNATVGRYNSLLSTTRKLIDRHNDIVKERNDIAVQEQELQKALDSRLGPPTVRQ